MNTPNTNDMIHIARWEWGEKEWSPFSAEEMDRRQNDLRAHMDAEGIDACLLTSWPNICYYSGGR